jgi:hypothetical protein
MMPPDTLGWVAATLMVATFSCRDTLWMRPLAVCNNLAFIAYACVAVLALVLAMHALLLPINLLRWWQSWQIGLTQELDVKSSRSSINIYQPTRRSPQRGKLRRWLWSTNESPCPCNSRSLALWRTMFIKIKSTSTHAQHRIYSCSWPH